MLVPNVNYKQVQLFTTKMTTSISLADLYKLLKQTEPIRQNGISDNSDIILKCPTIFGDGCVQSTRLRECMFLHIFNFQLNAPLYIEYPERDEHPVEFQFFIPIAYQVGNSTLNAGKYNLFGKDKKSLEFEFSSELGYQSKKKSFGTGKYGLTGSGVASQSLDITEGSVQFIRITIDSKLFSSFATDTSGEYPSELKHLIRNNDQQNYERFDTQTSGMQVAVQQILQCPYQGVTKRMYLESKVWELAALLIEEELKINQSPQKITPLKLSDIDRIHYAKEVLLKNLDNPPSLIQLARQVGLNDYKLKLGFRHCFGTTVFGYLHDHRMELAHKLLIESKMNVAEVAKKVGFASLPSFSNAFRKKFGVSPKSCQKQYDLPKEIIS